MKKKLKRIAGVLLLLIAAAGLVFWLRPVECLTDAMYAREYLSGVESRSVMVGGHRMHYNAEGPADGPVVVLVHGLGSRAEDWSNLAPYLAKAGYRVYMPDLFGFGRSEKPADFSYSVPDEAGAVLGFMGALGLKQVDLAGWSMGGWIAQILAIRHPERISKLVLFDSAGINDKPAWNTDLFMPVSAAQMNQLDALLMPHPPHVPGFVMRDILRGAKSHAWVTRRAMTSMLAGKDTTDALLPQLTMPVLIEWGELDRITPLSQSLKIHQLIPQSVLQVTPGCGHLAPLQCADQMAPGMVEFLKR